VIFSIQNQTHIQVDSDSQEQDQLTFVVQDAACFSQSAKERECRKQSFTLDFDKQGVAFAVIIIRCSKTSSS